MTKKFLILVITILAIYSVFFKYRPGQIFVMNVIALGVGKAFPEFPHVKPGEVSRDSILIDVREENERAVSMIPGAVTRVQFEHSRERFRKAKLVFYCTFGNRASEYAQIVRRDSFIVSNLRGGIIGWVQAGLPLVRNGGAAKKVHTQNKFFSLLVCGYVPVY
ncbi:MAG: hypothetical protein A4S09_13910 [Proteobacteria bacterium SG_bin7]|nr:MAG: hypothetical protein A4S09_13910 [Proteobacteria bacterium SG_bin7]